jgi:hypothetical protein
LRELRAFCHTKWQGGALIVVRAAWRRRILRSAVAFRGGWGGRVLVCWAGELRRTSL